jgi:probable selenium-dependent hydroxylase accessory protein YqeC
MWSLKEIDPLPSLVREKFISFVGAGGKTSLAEYLGAAAAGLGKRVVMTTTTKVRAKAPYVRFDDRGAAIRAEGGRFVLMGKSVDHGKLTALDPDEVEALGKEYDLVLVEADGAKHRPLKYPAAYEPVIPPCSDLTVVVAGLDALGLTIAEGIFRWEQFSRATGFSPDEQITPDVFVRLFESDGLMKNVDKAGRLILLNKYDACAARESAAELAAAVARRTGGTEVIVASVERGEFFSLV